MFKACDRDNAKSAFVHYRRVLLIMSFYMYLSSNDSQTLFAENRFYDFVVELPREYHFGNGRDWCFALIDLYVTRVQESARGRFETDVKLDKTLAVLCDLASSSYIANQEAPVLRLLPAKDEEGSSLYMPHYICVTKSSVNRIRIRLTNEDLKPVTDEDFTDARQLVLRCTLHFCQK